MRRSIGGPNPPYGRLLTAFPRPPSFLPWYVYQYRGADLCLNVARRSTVFHQSPWLPSPKFKGKMLQFDEQAVKGQAAFASSWAGQHSAKTRPGEDWAFFQNSECPLLSQSKIEFVTELWREGNDVSISAAFRVKLGQSRKSLPSGEFRFIHADIGARRGPRETPGGDDLVALLYEPLTCVPLRMLTGEKFINVRGVSSRKFVGKRRGERLSCLIEGTEKG
jgi:hypothetical protein